jgi:outer membrane cobalamin receptor
MLCTFFLWLALTLSPPDSTALSDTLGEVTVVGVKPVSATRHSAPLQTLDAAGIERLGVNDLHEAVRRFSGVTVKDYGGVGGLKTVSVRSLGAQHTAVSYDGIAVTDASSGQVDISRFALDNVAMISLAAGQTDDIFQTARLFASAGTLNISTLKPRFDGDARYNLAFKLKGGSFGLLNPYISGSYKLGDRWAVAANADYMRSDGDYPFTLTNGSLLTREKRLNSDIATMRAEATFCGILGEKGGTLETKVYGFDSERGLPGAVNLYNRTATERLWNDNAFVSTKYRNQLSRWFAVQGVGKYSYAFSRYRDVSDKYSAGFQEDRNTEQEWYGSAGVFAQTVAQTDGFTPSEAVSKAPFSFSLVTDFAHTTLDNNYINAAQPRRNTSLTVLASQYKTPCLTATASMLYTFIQDEVAVGNRPDARKRLSPAASLSWQPFINNALRLRASYKDIFRVPTFADLYYLRVGNASLKPEKAVQYNAGLTWSGAFGFFDYLSLTADAYYNRVEDKIVALPTLYIWRMLNMGEVRIKGLDVNLAAEFRLSRLINILLSGNYTWQYAIDVTDASAKNYRHQIPYTPRHTGNGSLSVGTPVCNVSYLLTAVGKRYVLPQNIADNLVEGYIEQSLSLSRTFQLRRCRLRLQGELLNIADAQYDVIRYYPMPGRSWRISVSLTL